MIKHRSNYTFQRRERGSVIIIVAFMLLVIIGFAGLAIDGGRSYGVKAQLSAASDAAALAGAQGLTVGANQAQRIANAQANAARFFTLNYPADFQMSTVYAPVTTVVPEGNGQWRVTVNARATTPNVFMNALGFASNEIRSISQTVRKDLDVVMVLDSSGSIGSALPTLKTAAKDGFVKNFISGAGGDRLGVVAFSSGSIIAEPIDRTVTRGFDAGRVNAAIDSLSLKWRTATSEGMRKALQELRAVPAATRSSLRVMLVFSDGAPNVFGVDIGGIRTNVLGDGIFRNPDTLDTPGQSVDVSTLPDYGTGGIPLAGRRTIYPGDSCGVNKASRNMTENVAAIARQEGIVVYSIGMGAQLNKIEVAGCGYGVDEYGAAILRRIANTDDQNPEYVANEPKGLYCHAPDANGLKSCFEEIASDILRLTM